MMMNDPNPYMKCYRWDFLKQRNEIVNIPKDCATFASEDLAPVRCPSCNRVHAYGEMYTSLRYQDAVGFGYMVCEHCYQQEHEMRRLLTPKVEAEE